MPIKTDICCCLCWYLYKKATAIGCWNPTAWQQSLATNLKSFVTADCWPINGLDWIGLTGRWCSFLRAHNGLPIQNCWQASGVILEPGSLNPPNPPGSPDWPDPLGLSAQPDPKDPPDSHEYQISCGYLGHIMGISWAYHGHILGKSWAYL